jgi:hypothetical protein
MLVGSFATAIVGIDSGRLSSSGALHFAAVKRCLQSNRS